MIYAIIAALLLTACATPSFKAADCQRFRYQDYNILACNDWSANSHCQRGIKTWDDGTIVNSNPGWMRACYEPGIFGRKGTIVIGHSHLKCLPHEIAHAEGKLSDKEVGEKYPCVGE